MQTPTIRPVSLEDAAPISGLSGQLGYPTTIEESKCRLAALIGSEHHRVLVACVGPELVGWIHVFLAHRVEAYAVRVI